MPVWMQNLKTRLADKPVLILHGNVRDRYIDQDGRIYENLTALLVEIARGLTPAYPSLLVYDPVGGERRLGETLQSPVRPVGGDDEFAATAPTSTGPQRLPPTRVLANWARLFSSSQGQHLGVLFYLDKLVAYKRTYAEDEREALLWLEKIIENIRPNHRLILVALQDTMVPIELYTNSPKTAVLPVPTPDKTDRLAYLHHCLGEQVDHLELIADLTDGLFLRDLAAMVDDITAAAEGELSRREVRRLINRYRIGEQTDHWGQLSIERLNEALPWFVEEEGIKGQEEALRKIIDVLCLARAGLSGVASGTAARPRGFLFFAGPTGVGKTFAAKKLAKFLFGTEEAFLRFDMSEYKEEHTVSKLIGSPPGYVGYERGGMLTNAVRERPFAVILFDEMEKAHPKIMDIFLQLLDEGRLTDSRGQTIFFTETVIIFTSNLGTRTTDSRGMPITEQKDLEAILGDGQLSPEERRARVREHFVQAVERFFIFEISRPELLNRIGNNIVPFNYIHTVAVQRDIVLSHLKRICGDFEDRYRTVGYRLAVGDGVADWLVDTYSSRIRIFGGRGITNALEDEVMIPLSRAVLRVEHYGRQGVVFHLAVAPDGQGIEVQER